VVFPDQDFGTWRPRTPPRRHNGKIKLGLRSAAAVGKWIAGPVLGENGGSSFHAVADYFQDRAGCVRQQPAVDKTAASPGLVGLQD